MGGAREAGPLSINQLAAATETTAAATTQLVNGLVAAGYVTRERPANDKSRFWSLSPIPADVATTSAKRS
jgi:DNA-binding MarR family transcriptional regulator